MCSFFSYGCAALYVCRADLFAQVVVFKFFSYYLCPCQALSNTIFPCVERCTTTITSWLIDKRSRAYSIAPWALRPLNPIAGSQKTTHCVGGFGLHVDIGALNVTEFNRRLRAPDKQEAPSIPTSDYTEFVAQNSPPIHSNWYYIILNSFKPFIVLSA